MIFRNRIRIFDSGVNIPTMKPLPFLFPSIALILLSAVLPVCANTIVYQNGSSNTFVSNYNGAQGTNINNLSDANLNYGSYGEPNAYNGFTEGLLRFDLSSFAGQYSSVNSVSLQLVVRGISGITTGTINAYVILPANSGWVQGTASSAVQNGSSCWNYAKYNTQAWVGSAGLGTAGTDYDSTLLGSFTYTSTGTCTMNFTGYNSAQLTSLVTSWNSATNPGILLMDETPGSGAQFLGTSPSGGSQFLPQSPQLTINYTVPEPGTSVLVAVGLAVFGLRKRRR